jgi:hypothetical protein
MRSRNAWALAALITIGTLELSGNPIAATPLGHVQSRVDRATVDPIANPTQGDVHLVKKGEPGAKFGKGPPGPKFGKGPPGPKFGKLHHDHTIYRGRRFKEGLHWYFWAPWIGAYLYYENYDACYVSCRDRGYSRNYCRDLCYW